MIDDATLERACFLDAAGILPGRGETAEELFARAERIVRLYTDLKERLLAGETVRLFDEFEADRSRLIDPEAIEGGSGRTEELYGFRTEYVNGFYLSRELGLLFGGCLIWDTGDENADLAVFLLRDVFRKKKRWLFYRRDELAAHELCHGARRFLHEAKYEEHFAYRTARGVSLRKLLGGGFSGVSDSLIFVLPSLVLVAAAAAESFGGAQLPMPLFWTLAALGPLWICGKSMRLGVTVRRAAERLAKFGKAGRPGAALFRLDAEEIETIAGMKTPADWEAFDRAHAGELRWEVIKRRFF